MFFQHFRVKNFCSMSAAFCKSHSRGVVCRTPELEKFSSIFEMQGGYGRESFFCMKFSKSDLFFLTFCRQTLSKNQKCK